MALSSVATVKGGETLERSMTVLFSVKFSAYHSPNFFFPDSRRQINNTGSSFLLLVEHIQAFMGEFSFAFVLCCENIAATVWRPAWRAVKPLHSVFQLTSLRALLWNGFLDIYSLINNDKKEVHWRTLQLQFEGLHRQQLILFSVFQPTSLRSQLWNGFINVYSIISNDQKKKVHKSSTFYQNWLYEFDFKLIIFTGWRWKFILYTNLLAAFIQAGKLDWMGVYRE